MTYQTFSLTEQTFPEIGRNDQSLSDTIWTLDHDKYSAKIFLDKPIYKLLPKTTRSLYTVYNKFFFCRKREPIKCLKIIHFAHH